MTFHRCAYYAAALCGLMAITGACAPSAGSRENTENTPSPSAGASPTSTPKPATPSTPAPFTPTPRPTNTPTGTLSTPTTALSTPTIPSGSSIPPEAAAAVTAAKNDLARRERLQASDVGVATVTAMQWPSTALGCPEPGMAYAQVITDGFKIVLIAGGKEYEYHSDRSSRVVLCQQR